MDHHDDDGAPPLRVLLGVLAGDEDALFQRPPDPAELSATARWVRARFELYRERDLRAGLAHARLTRDEFTQHLRTLTHVSRALKHHHGRIDALLPRYRAVFSAGDFLIGREDT